MRVGSVPCDDHIVPLVVVQRVVAVPLQQAGPVPQVEHVVDEPGRRGGTEDIDTQNCLFKCLLCA